MQEKSAKKCSACSAPCERIYSRAFCKECNNVKTLDRQRRFKLACIEEMGGFCECGESRPHCLAFFHQVKGSYLSTYTGQVPIKQEVRDELSKCKLVCRNCLSQNIVPNCKGSRKKQILINMFGGECSWCAYRGNARSLEFHHIEPATKVFEICRIKIRILCLETLINEARKCILICSNCHADHHVSERDKRYDGIRARWELVRSQKLRARERELVD